MDKKHILSLDGDVFGALKADFDSVLRRALNEMMERDISAGKLTVTLNIDLKDGYAQDPETSQYEGERKTVIPKFSHKVKSTLQYSAEAEGYVGGDEYELVWDKDAEAYILTRTDNQTTIYDFPPDDLPGADEEDDQ